MASSPEQPLTRRALIIQKHHRWIEENPDHEVEAENTNELAVLKIAASPFGWQSLCPGRAYTHDGETFLATGDVFYHSQRQESHQCTPQEGTPCPRYAQRWNGVCMCLISGRGFAPIDDSDLRDEIMLNNKNRGTQAPIQDSSGHAEQCVTTSRYRRAAACNTLSPRMKELLQETNKKWKLAALKHAPTDDDKEHSGAAVVKSPDHEEEQQLVTCNKGQAFTDGGHDNKRKRGLPDTEIGGEAASGEEEYALATKRRRFREGTIAKKMRGAVPRFLQLQTINNKTRVDIENVVLLYGQILWPFYDAFTNSGHSTKKVVAFVGALLDIMHDVGFRTRDGLFVVQEQCLSGAYNQATAVRPAPPFEEPSPFSAPQLRTHSFSLQQQVKGLTKRCSDLKRVMDDNSQAISDLYKSSIAAHERTTRRNAQSFRL